MSTKDQGYSLTLVQISQIQYFLNVFSSTTIRLVEAKFRMEPPWDGGTNACSNDPGHMTQDGRHTHIR